MTPLYVVPSCLIDTVCTTPPTVICMLTRPALMALLNVSRADLTVAVSTVDRSAMVACSATLRRRPAAASRKTASMSLRVMAEPELLTRRLANAVLSAAFSSSFMAFKSMPASLMAMNSWGARVNGFLLVLLLEDVCGEQKIVQTESISFG